MDKRMNRLVVVFSLAVVVAVLSVPKLAAAGFSGGPVTNIVWSTWATDPGNDICFAVEGRWIHFNTNSTSQGKSIAALLLSSLHTGRTVTVEHFDDLDYECGMVGRGRRATGFDFHNTRD